VKGNLREGPRPGTWELRVSLGRDPLTGKYRQVSRTITGTRREAQAALAGLVTEVTQGAHLSGGGSDAIVAELLVQWLDLVADRLSPTTMHNYRGYARRYLADGIGQKQVRKVTTRDVDRLYQALSRDRGLSARTVRQVHAILSGAFRQAVRWGWIRTSPVAASSPPPVRKADVHPPDLDAALRLLVAADQYDADFGVFLRLAAATGARRGELCGLWWNDVDLAAGTLVVAHNLIELDGGGWLRKDTKTHQSRRIALDTATIAALERHWAVAHERAAACGIGVRADAFVFSSVPTGEAPWLPNYQTRRFMALCRKVGVGGVRLHDLRHMHATQLLGANVDVRTVAGRLGHANAATTLGVYAQFLQARDRDAAQVIGSLLDS
jgi:integrase